MGPCIHGPLSFVVGSTFSARMKFPRKLVTTYETHWVQEKLLLGVPMFAFWRLAFLNKQEMAMNQGVILK